MDVYKPHLPFYSPKKYWDLYDREKIKQQESYVQPKTTPNKTFYNFGELRQYENIPVRKTGLGENTNVILWRDYKPWSKHVIFETALRGHLPIKASGKISSETLNDTRCISLFYLN